MEAAGKDYNKNMLDIFRIAATVQVFLGHAVTHFKGLESAEQAVYFFRGVPVLFILCGFLAAKTIEGRSVKKWMTGRAVRIFPEFWMCIIVNTIIIFGIYEIPGIKDAVWYFVTQFLGLNFYTGEWLRGYGVGTPNGVLWTITVQIQFFLAVPWIHKKMKDKPVSAWGGVLVGCMLLSIVISRCEKILSPVLYKIAGVSVFAYLYFLLFGMMVWYHREKLIFRLEKYRYFILASYIVWKLCEINYTFPKVLNGVLYNTVTTMLTGGVIFAFSFRHTFHMKYNLTYGFYLYHMVFINIAVNFGYDSFQPAVQGICVILLIVSMTLFSAFLSMKYIERPFYKLWKTHSL